MKIKFFEYSTEQGFYFTEYGECCVAIICWISVSAFCVGMLFLFLSADYIPNQFDVIVFPGWAMSCSAYLTVGGYGVFKAFKAVKNLIDWEKQ